jgi:hypothetical protein
MRALTKVGLALSLVSGWSTAFADSSHVVRHHLGASTVSTTSCDGTFEDLARCKALLSFPADLRAYLVDIPVLKASKVPGALAAYYFLEDRIETSPRLPAYGEAWAILTMRHEFVHALSWKLPGFRDDARVMFAGLRVAIVQAEADRHAFTKYDQWFRGHAEYVDDLPHFITGIVELMAPGEMPASLNSYFAPILRATPLASTISADKLTSVDRALKTFGPSVRLPATTPGGHLGAIDVNSTGRGRALDPQRRFVDRASW